MNANQERMDCRSILQVMHEAAALWIEPPGLDFEGPSLRIHLWRDCSFPVALRNSNGSGDAATSRTAPIWPSQSVTPVPTSVIRVTRSTRAGLIVTRPGRPSCNHAATAAASSTVTSLRSLTQK